MTARSSDPGSSMLKVLANICIYPAYLAPVAVHPITGGIAPVCHGQKGGMRRGVPTMAPACVLYMLDRFMGVYTIVYKQMFARPRAAVTGLTRLYKIDTPRSRQEKGVNGASTCDPRGQPQNESAMGVPESFRQ